MAVDDYSLAFIAAARNRGVSFRRVATMGRQNVVLSRRGLATALMVAGRPEPRTAPRVTRGWLEDVLDDFGAEETISIDASVYEGAAIVEDLNLRLPEALEGTFSAVIDVGTLEHVFNFPTALSNYMRLVEEGGHLLLVVPTNNEGGHGFFQFSPELLYRALSPTYGFTIDAMLLLELGAWRPRWYAVLDPAAVGSRGQFRSRFVTYLFVLARRVGPIKQFDPPPQQSDYVSRWGGAQGPSRVPTQLLLRAMGDAMPRFKRGYRAIMPSRRSLYARRSYRNLPSHFVRVRDPGDAMRIAGGRQ